MIPAEAARGLVVFANPKGPLAAQLVEADQELLAGSVPFRTTRGLEVLPVEARLYYKAPLEEERRAEVEELYQKLYASYEEEERELAFYETRVLEAPANGVTLPALDLAAETLDGALWIALLARPGDDPEAARAALGNRVLTLGVLPALGAGGCRVAPGSEAGDEQADALNFDVPDAAAAPAPKYRRLQAHADGNLLARPGLVELELPGPDELAVWEDLDPLEAGVGAFPPSLEGTGEAERLATWIRMRPRDLAVDAAGASQQLRARLSWVGVNASEVVQRAHVAAEELPTGTGEPDQAAALSQTPVILDSVRLTVNGEPWTRVDDLGAAPPEVPQTSPRLASEALAEAGAPPAEARVYTLDRESGELAFGSGIHGMRPPRGARIRAAYDHGGGPAGQVAIGAIQKAPALPAGLAVTNPVPTWGGDRAETVAEAERRIPAWLRHRDRLVSAADFEEIARRTPGVDLGRVDVLPELHPALPDQPSPGAVTVIVVPAQDALHPRSPEPDALFLETVCAWLAPRRLVTTELHVRGPSYVPVWASVGIEVVPGREAAPVREAVAQRLERFLSALTGGFEEQGWPLGHDVDAQELVARAAQVSGVAKVSAVLLGTAAGPSAVPVPLAPLELPRLAGVAVASGDPVPVEELIAGAGEPEEEPVEADAVFPVPVVPEDC